MPPAVPQILKRHRDVHFQSAPKEKPISVIVTTLAGHSYNGDPDIYGALEPMVREMENHIEVRDGDLWVPNPGNPMENFAEKWNSHPERYTAFRGWLEKVRADVRVLGVATNRRQLKESMDSMFGDGPVDGALRRFGSSHREARERGRLAIDASTGALGAAGIPVRSHRFYGA